ncbi:MAG: hypothetical protein ACJ8F7_13085 [Gemmataceae bacterium]
MMKVSGAEAALAGRRRAGSFVVFPPVKSCQRLLLTAAWNRVGYDQARNLSQVRTMSRRRTEFGAGLDQFAAPEGGKP